MIWITIWILFILAFNYLDYRTTKDGGKPDYVKYFIIRGMAAIVHAIPVIKSPPYMDDSWQWTKRALISWSPILVFQVCSFWVVYEVVRNIWSKKPLLYYDHQEKDSGVIDRFFAWSGPTAHAFFKVLALVLAFVSAMLILNV